MNLTLSHRIFGSSPAVKPHDPGGKRPPVLCGNDVKAPFSGRGYEGAGTAYGRAQS